MDKKTTPIEVVILALFCFVYWRTLFTPEYRPLAESPASTPRSIAYEIESPENGIDRMIPNIIARIGYSLVFAVHVLARPTSAKMIGVNKAIKVSDELFKKSTMFMVIKIIY